MNVANFVADPDYVQQAFATSEPFFAQQAGIETRVLLTSDAGYSPYRVMFTTRDFLQQHPDIVAQIRASVAARDGGTILNDPAAAHAAIAKLNPALNARLDAFHAGRHCATAISSPATIRAARNWARWIRSAGTRCTSNLLDLKVIDKPFDPATAYTLQFVGSK